LLVHLLGSVQGVHHLFSAHKHVLLIVCIVLLPTFAGTEPIGLIAAIELRPRHHLRLINSK